MAQPGFQLPKMGKDGLTWPKTLPRMSEMGEEPWKCNAIGTDTRWKSCTLLTSQVIVQDIIKRIRKSEAMCSALLYIYAAIRAESECDLAFLAR